MAGCEYFHMSCAAFFSEEMADKMAIGEVFKQRYCLGKERESCARLVVREKLGPFAIPKNLWPNHADVAGKLLADAG
jgi:hypothetical protein